MADENTYLFSALVHIIREKPERGHAIVLGGTLFLSRTAALTGSIFELAEFIDVA